MKLLSKKALLYGGGGLVAIIAIYYIFRKKPSSTIINDPLPPNPKPDNSSYPALVLAKQGTRLREEPNTNSNILDTFDLGVMLYPDGAKSMSDGVWYHVTEGGWVRSDVVTSPDSSSSSSSSTSNDKKYTPIDDTFSPTPTYNTNIDEMFTLSKRGSSVTNDFTLKR
jgi:hypothetical protein